MKTSTRLVSAAVTACTLFSASSALAAVERPQQPTFAPNPFTDVPAKSSYFEAIEYLRKNNVLKGYEDGTFRPEARINRAEFVKLITNPFILDTERLNGCLEAELDDSDMTVFFPDVLRDSWYGPEVCLAKVKKLINGYPDGYFRPGEYTSFVEAAKIVASTFVLQTTTDPEDERWFMPYVNKLSEDRAIPTTISTFDQTITRGEMAEMLYRLKTNTTNRPSRTASQLR